MFKHQQAQRTARLKWQWAQWPMAPIGFAWCQQTTKHNVGRPPNRWSDNLVKVARM